jgi:hypothetical protein
MVRQSDQEGALLLSNVSRPGNRRIRAPNQQAGAGFRALTEAVDTTGPAGRMVMQMLGPSRSSSAP